MSLDTAGILTEFQRHATDLGGFEAVLTHEPKSAPTNGITLAYWVDSMYPLATASGLDAVTVVLVIKGRIYVPFLSEPEDAIDAALYAAADPLITSLVGEFTLSGKTRNVDLFSESGTEFGAVYGYLTQDKIVFRVLELTAPVIVNDAYVEAP